MIQHYWRRFSRKFVIKSAFSHLILGVIAAGLSLSEQSITVRAPSQNINIMTITSVVDNLQNSNSILVKSHISQNIASLNTYHDLTSNDDSSDVVQNHYILMPVFHGIRAGPALV